MTWKIFGLGVKTCSKPPTPFLYYLYPILIHYRTFFSQSIKSEQYPQALQLTAGVILRPRLTNYPRGRACKKKSDHFFFDIASQCRKLVIKTDSMSSYMAPYLRTLAELKRELYPILIQYQAHSDFALNRKVVGSQSESRTKNLKFRQSIRIEYVTQKHPRALG